MSQERKLEKACVTEAERAQTDMFTPTELNSVEADGTFRVSLRCLQDVIGSTCTEKGNDSTHFKELGSVFRVTNRKRRSFRPTIW